MDYAGVVTFNGTPGVPLNLLADGQQVSADEAVQLRMWAVRPEDILLPLEEIANGILNEESSQTRGTTEDSSEG